MVKASAVVTGLALVLIAGSASAGGSAGAAGAFLDVPGGARPSGMGYAFVSVADDASALYFNPGGLYQVKRRVLGATYSAMYMKRIAQEWAFVYPNLVRGTLGLMAKTFAVADIDGRDIYGYPTGKFDDTELALSVGYGTQIRSKVGIGANLKYINQSLSDKSASGWGLDVGLLMDLHMKYAWLQSLRWGMCVSNLGAHLKWNTDSSHRDKVPTTSRVGVGLGFDAHRVNILVSLEHSMLWLQDAAGKYHCGVEASIPLGGGVATALRAGFVSDDGDIDGTWGASVEWWRYRIDYAYCPDRLAEERPTSKIGVQVGF